MRREAGELSSFAAGWFTRTLSPARLRAALLAALAYALVLSASAHAHEAAPVHKLDFEPPAPGSYKLARIMPVPAGRVLDLDGKTKPLAQFTSGKVTLLGFIYTSCADPKGCPVAYDVFVRLKKEILARGALRDKVRFVTLSFDPLRDTPKVMQAYGGSHVRETDGLQWYFLTTRSAKDLLPLLDGFGQDVQVAVDAKTGKVSRELSHVLKLFLIDKAGQTREIYTTSFLIPEVVMNDIFTLLMEDGMQLSELDTVSAPRVKTVR